MRMLLTAAAPARGSLADVVVDADVDARVGDVAVELARVMRAETVPATQEAARLGRHRAAEAVVAPLQAVGAPLYVDGELIDPVLSVAESPLRPGCVVSLGDASGCLPKESSGLAEIRVVGGPAAGAIHRLPTGTAEVGSASQAFVWVPDPEVPPRALRLTVDSRGACQVDPTGEVVASLERQPLTAKVPWLPGQQVAVGGSLLELALCERPDAALHPSEDGAGLDFNRPPRLLPPVGETKFKIPDAPAKDQSRLFSYLAGAVVMAIGPLAGGLSGHWDYAAVSVLGPVLMLVPNLMNRRQGRKSYAQKYAQYREYRERIENSARKALETERAQRRSSSPDPAAILAIATGPRRRLWERRRSDPDYLLLRVGTADLPSKIEIHDPNADEPKDGTPLPIPDCSVTIPLYECGVLGVAGPGGTPQQIGSWLVAQAAALHSPNDLQIYLVTDPSARQTSQATWEWTRWLPHCRQPDASAVALVGNDADTRAARIRELTDLITARQSLRGGGSAGPAPRDVLVVLDGSRRLRTQAGVPTILGDGPQVGVYAICLDSDERLLPSECQAMAIVEGGGLRVQQTGAAQITGVRPDFVRPGWCMRLARGVAPIRDVTDQEGGLRLPGFSRQLDLLGLDPPTPGKIAAGWQAGGSSTTAVVGEAADGPFAIDVRRDGPHGLIAGTTGAGKSELLQTIVAALAVANRPDAMTFVLVDYKGGAAFKDCVNLPHTVGMATNLNAHLVARALTSLKAELERRQRILETVGAKNIEQYDALRARSLRSRSEVPGSALAPMPRLMIIIDEFAALAKELPDFVSGLVNIAQQGRSLGIHLILATQRPSGVVSADIRANTNLRIALRVTDQGDSTDVIDAPDAARISEATQGRAYARLGHATLVPFQAGYLGGSGPGADAEARNRVWAARVGWADLGRAEPHPPAAKKREEGELTDLKVLVDAIGRASEGLGIPPQHRPWLEPLPELVRLDELQSAGEFAAGDAPLVPFGMTDIPVRQTREPMVLDIAHGGHVVIAGAPRSGRSTVMRTIAGSVAAHTSPADVHIYALDCGAGMLLPLTSLPHCGAVVTRDQTERVERLLARLRGEIVRRQQLLAAGGFAGIAEQRARTADPAQRLPWMVLLLHWWEGFNAAFEKYDFGRLIDGFLQLLREGAGVGLCAVVTTDRLALTGHTGTVFERRMLLRLTDPGDSTLAGISERSLPSNQPAGRIVIEGTPDPLEVQVAVLDSDASGPAQVAALQRLGEASLAKYGPPGGTQQPLRVDPLPSRITLEETWQLAPGFTPPSPLWALVGVGGDELEPVGLDICDEGPGLTVAGPPRSGRSATLLTMTTSLLAGGTPVLVVTPRRSPLRALDGRPGVLGVLGSDAEPDDVTAAVSGLDRFAVVVDDAELLFNGPLSAPLEKILASGRDAEHGLIIAGATGDLGRAFSGFIKETLKSRCGVLVAVEAPTDGDLFGVRLPRNAGPGPLGRGLLVRPGTFMPVQLAVTG
jgi:DNA segregation ATPase FtsK/SpoIIIE, S-DNA-T family